MLFAAQRKDLPMLTAGVLIIGIVYMLATLIADLIDRLDEPPDPAGRGTLMDVTVSPTPGRAGRRPGRLGTSAGPSRDAAGPGPAPGVHHRQHRHHRLDHHAPSSANGSRRTTRSTTSPLGHLPPSPEHWMGTDRLGRDVLSRVMVGSRDVLIVAPLAALLGVAAGHASWA